MDLGKEHAFIGETHKKAKICIVIPSVFDFTSYLVMVCQRCLLLQKGGKDGFSLLKLSFTVRIFEIILPKYKRPQNVHGCH